MQITPVIDRIFAKCSVSESGCVEFTGCTNANGYGRIGMGCRSAGVALVHRAVWEHYKGPIPDGLPLDHLCRNRRCCRLDHLEAVDIVTNVRRGAGWSLVGGEWFCRNGHHVSGRNVANVASKKGAFVRCRACWNASAAEGRKRKEALAEDGVNDDLVTKEAHNE